MTYRYPRASLAGDWARAGGGLAATLGPLLALELAPAAIAILAALALLFAIHAVDVARRARTRFEVDADAIAERPRGTRLAWDGLSRVSLAYFSVRRDSAVGWMELELRGAGARMRLDSRLDGFEEVAERAMAAAARGGLALDPATASNFAALGLAEEHAG